MKTQPTTYPALAFRACVIATGLLSVGVINRSNAQAPQAPTPPAATYNQNSSIEGTVAQYIMNPDGNVDGLLLGNNTIVRFPPHMGQLLAQTVSPRDTVKVDGFTEAANTIHAWTIADLRTQRSLTDTPPGPGNLPPVPNPAAR